MCGFIGVRIRRHLSQQHAISKEEHLRLYGPVGSTKDSARNRELANFDWINRANARGDDLSAYKAKMGKAVSNAIMADPAERQRRAEQRGKNNRQPEARAKASEAAKRTSARPEVIAARTENLRAWRKREPDKFQAIVAKMIGFRTSKPEKATLLFLQQAFPALDFKGNQQLRSNERFLINKSRIRQIDIMSRPGKLIVEVDGWLHFNEVDGWTKLDAIRAKDAELNRALPLMGYMLVRISYDQWRDRDGELTDECKQRLVDIVSSHREPGVCCIGECYGTPVVDCEQP